MMVITQSHLTSPPDGGLNARHLPYLMRALVAALFLVGSACAQEWPTLNEFTTWFGGQFANEHAFSETDNGRLYQIESRYTRLIYAGGPFAVRWVFDIVPMTLVGDPWQKTGRRYAYGGGGSPIGAQVNWMHYRRFQPFLTSGGGFLYFNRNMFNATHFNFTAQLGGGVQLFNSSRRRSFDVGCKYHHISNANLGNRNHGMDSLMLFVGVSFFK
jgi:hypothetical protein